jgi:hypothetical protein
MTPAIIVDPEDYFLLATMKTFISIYFAIDIAFLYNGTDFQSTG